MLVILTALQSQAPGSAMGAKSMLPMLLMNKDSKNEELLMFIMMMNNHKC